jgi:hypothetical protein
MALIYCDNATRQGLEAHLKKKVRQTHTKDKERLIWCTKNGEER